MTPSEHSSGGHVRIKDISVDKEKSLSEFNRISIKAGGKKAIFAVARRLVGHVRACFRKGCFYKTELVQAIPTVLRSAGMQNCPFISTAGSCRPKIHWQASHP